jgi:hypothetical protein
MEPNNIPEISATEIFEVNYIYEGGYLSANKFLVLSDNKGVTIYDTTGINIDTSISLVIDTGTIVNATSGVIREDNFNIVSYSNIHSGVDIKHSLTWDTDDCFQSSPVDRNMARLVITDISQIQSTINPINDSYVGSINLQGDSLVIVGSASSLLRDANYQVAIRETEDSDLMSMVIPREDWTWINETQSMVHTVSFDDFSNTSEHIIQLERSDSWKIIVKVCDADGRFIATQRQTINYLNHLQEGNFISIYLNEDIDVNKVKLTLDGTSNLSGYQHNWIYDGIPSSIDFEANRIPTFTILNNEEFEISSTFDYNLNVLTYNYGTDYDWTIIKRGGDNIAFVKPSLTNQILTTYPNIDTLIDTPVKATNTMYKTDGEITDITKVHKAVIPRNSNNEPDFNYSFKKSTTSF